MPTASLATAGGRAAVLLQVLREVRLMEHAGRGEIGEADDEGEIADLIRQIARIEEHRKVA